jgi:nucleoside-diphosphate-sugar epimerase
MNYIVTGAAGFIGSRVSEMLLGQGHFVLGIDNLNDSYDPQLKHWRLQQLEKYPDFEFHENDISDIESMKAVCDHRQYAAVFNIAGRAGVRASVENPWLFVQSNTIGTLNMLEICRMYGIPKFILSSTSSMYGENAVFPTPETAESNLPLQPYSASKKGAEAMCHAYHYLHGIDVTVFRYFTVYGPAGRPDMVMFRFAKWIAEDEDVILFGDGEQSRGFTYLDDIARGTIQGLKPVGYELINLGGHEVISLNEMIRILEQKIGKKARVVYLPEQKADIRCSQADVSKARQILDWEPQVSLDQGIQSLVDWYARERDWAVNLTL